MSDPQAYDAPHGIYQIVRGHAKRGFGFWKPAGMLSEGQIVAAVSRHREQQGPNASWRRCQGLSQVAQGIANRERRTELLREAFAAADQQPELNRIVTVAAWPLRALLELGEQAWFEREVARLTPIILPEPNPFRRQDGLYALLFVDAPRPSLEHVLALFGAACQDTQKVQTLRRVAEYLNPTHHAEAVEVGLLIRDPRRRRRTLRAIGAVLPP